MSITEFDERRTLKWGDFLLELEDEIKGLDKYPLRIRPVKDKKEERLKIKKLINKGEEIQEQLNEDWLDYGYMTFQQYMKQMNHFIIAQDDIINSIKGFIENCHEYYKGMLR